MDDSIYQDFEDEPDHQALYSTSDEEDFEEELDEFTLPDDVDTSIDL